MSLYNLVLGTNPAAGFALAAVGLKPAQVPRFRDAWLEWSDDGHTTPLIVILTRTGGGNRDYYGSPGSSRTSEPGSGYTGPFNADLCALPLYLSNKDDEYDATFAHFYFAVPPECLEMARTVLAEFGEPESMRERMEQVMELLKQAGPAKES